MSDERITVNENAERPEEPVRTVIVERSAESGGAGKWIFLLLLAVALIGGFLFYDRMTGSEIAKDEAIADAAAQVGNAANEVGEAANEAGEAVEDAAERLDGE